MADTPSSDDIQKALEKQIADLRKEIAKINKTVSARSAEMMDDAREQASSLYESASDRASKATQQLRTQAHAVSEVARENPGTTTAVLGFVGIVGFLLGIAVGQASSEPRRRWY
ncbi:hypothetical protein G6N74_19790 [Mesorhizobium sp. CGMCC 1.15528]|uniref:DUF883 family protein n=1 Tax=Mesorhizobium zhangyense TaxID=1776730 RepID=A0A7C9R9C7_9HYPH|nr:hypothetical protein [Mesorhizobium zhangyense]NGN43317.1 hypothetical protein [Mesorhizobium zhangyense]